MVRSLNQNLIRLKRLYLNFLTLRLIAVTSLVMCMPAAQAAVDVIEFEDESVRLQYQGLVEELRCPKCPNQNLIGTDSGIAYDLRREVARLVKEGKTNKQIKTYMVNRYGDFVLYEPPVNKKTWILWWSPVLMIFIGLVVFVVVVYRRSKLISPKLDTSTSDKSS